MVSSKVLSNASFVCPARSASATTPSEMVMVMVILYTEGEDEMSSLAGTPFHLGKLQHLSDLFLMFFHFFPSCFFLCYPFPCVVVLHIVSFISSVSSGLKN